MARHVVDDVWVWDEGGTVVGFMILRSGDELFLMYLEPAATGRGIGSLSWSTRSASDRTDSVVDLPGERRRAPLRERHGLCTIAFGDGTGNEEGVPDVQYAWRPTPT